MCFLCLANDVFLPPPPKSRIERKMERARLIKEILEEAKDKKNCDKGNLIADELKQEQYQLAREL